MSEADSFETLIQKVRTGDQQAAAELISRYEPEIRREIRLRLTDRRLRRMIDSVDICQSVLGNFFARAALGQFDLQSPDQLMKLLATMARNRVVYWARKQHAQKRDAHREQSLAVAAQEQQEPLTSEPSPSQHVQGAELLEEIRRRLPELERRIALRRAAGYDWLEISKELGGTQDSLRKRFKRALDKVAGELEL